MQLKVKIYGVYQRSWFSSEYTSRIFILDVYPEYLSRTVRMLKDKIKFLLDNKDFSGINEIKLSVKDKNYSLKGNRIDSFINHNFVDDSIIRFIRGAL